MAVERWWSRTRHTPTVEPDCEDCPICVHLNRWHGDLPVRKVSHGASSPGREWRACWEHYKVVAAFEWLNWTGVFKSDSLT